MHFRSLRFKLTLWYVLILGTILISFSAFLYMTLSKSLHRDVDNRLRSLADLIASESGSPMSRFGFGSLDEAVESSLRLRPTAKFIQVLDESGAGEKLENLKNVQLPISLLALRNASRGRETFETTRSFRNIPLRIFTYPVFEKDRMARVVQVASSLGNVEDTLHTLLLILSISVPSALVVASLGGLFLANKALRPVDQVTETARIITSHNLDQKIEPPRVKDEISRLVETFNDMISRLNRSFHQIKQFSADASHELKTPLTILRGEVEVALRKERMPSEYEEILRSNLEEVHRMSKIVEDLLLLSKTDMGEVRLNKETMNPTKVLDEVVTHLSLLWKAKQLTVTTVNHQEDIAFFGDALRFRQLLLNLIENSIKYTEPGGAIQVTLEKENHSFPSKNGQGEVNALKIVVSDTGIGIAQEEHEKIFDRFYRVDKARSRDQGGSGLGLSICKWIVEAHHGNITVESEVGKGSSFIVRLPL